MECSECRIGLGLADAWLDDGGPICAQCARSRLLQAIAAHLPSHVALEALAGLSAHALRGLLMLIELDTNLPHIDRRDIIMQRIRSAVDAVMAREEEIK